MGKRHHPIVVDEIRYLFDTLQDNSIKNIANITGINTDKVGKVLNPDFNK